MPPLRSSNTTVPWLKNYLLASPPAARTFATTIRPRKWQGRQAEDHTSRLTDQKGVQHEAVKEGKKEREVGGSRGAGEESGKGVEEKVREEFPEAPDVIGMQDERGGKISGESKKK